MITDFTYDSKAGHRWIDSMDGFSRRVGLSVNLILKGACPQLKKCKAIY